MVNGFPICHDCHRPIEPQREGFVGSWRHVDREARKTCSYASYNAPRPFLPFWSGPIPTRTGLLDRTGFLAPVAS